MGGYPAEGCSLALVATHVCVDLSKRGAMVKQVEVVAPQVSALLGLCVFCMTNAIVVVVDDSTIRSRNRKKAFFFMVSTRSCQLVRDVV
jgi:hypothetical protein